jgi:hypothetical protein
MVSSSQMSFSWHPQSLEAEMGSKVHLHSGFRDAKLHHLLVLLYTFSTLNERLAVSTPLASAGLAQLVRASVS